MIGIVALIPIIILKKGFRCSILTLIMLSRILFTIKRDMRNIQYVVSSTKLLQLAVARALFLPLSIITNSSSRRILSEPPGHLDQCMTYGAHLTHLTTDQSRVGGAAPPRLVGSMLDFRVRVMPPRMGMHSSLSVTTCIRSSVVLAKSPDSQQPWASLTRQFSFSFPQREDLQHPKQNNLL